MERPNLRDVFTSDGGVDESQADLFIQDEVAGVEVSVINTTSLMQIHVFCRRPFSGRRTLYLWELADDGAAIFQSDGTDQVPRPIYDDDGAVNIEGDHFYLTNLPYFRAISDYHQHEFGDVMVETVKDVWEPLYEQYGKRTNYVFESTEGKRDGITLRLRW